MTDQKYIDLMNMELDGANTAAQTAELHDYLDRTPDARRHFEELGRLVRRLDEEPDVDPPTHLIHRILDAIPFGRQTHPRRAHSTVSRVPAWLGWLFTRPRLAAVTSFALGLAAGVILFTTISYNGSGDADISRLLDISQISGTMGSIDKADQLPVSDAVSVDLARVQGHIRLHESDSQLFADVSLRSSDPIEWVFEFDHDVSFGGFRQLREGGGDVTVTDTQMNVHQRGDNRYILYFSHETDSPTKVRFRVLKDGQLLLEESLRVSVEG